MQKEYNLGSIGSIYYYYYVYKAFQFGPGGGPLQMLLTLTLNLLPASPKNSATGPTFGPF